MSAYELRISGWSSDVCSSDLMVVVRKAAAYLTGLLFPQQLETTRQRRWLTRRPFEINAVVRRQRLRQFREGALQQSHAVWRIEEHDIEAMPRLRQVIQRVELGNFSMLRFEIGSASCRERVCKYV